MPVKIKDGLPAAETLAHENVFVMTDTRATTQEIRPLRILVLNLMPTKITTETQILRALSNTPLQCEVRFLHTASYRPSNVSSQHLDVYYKTFVQAQNEKWDGLIITGAPVENMKFEKVAYWDELTEIMDWADGNVFSTLFICWAAQAGLYHHYGIEKHSVKNKVFGVFLHTVTDSKNRLTRGFDDAFWAPHSRHTAVDEQAIIDAPHLELLATSKEAGAYLAASPDGRRVFITGHSEYDADTLKWEYDRDVAAGKKIDIPVNYFPDNDPTQKPHVRWRAHATLLFTNWMNYCVYQETPYDLDELTRIERL